MPTYLVKCLILLFVNIIPVFAHADACRPTVPVANFSNLKFLPDSFSVPAAIEATLASDLLLEQESLKALQLKFDPGSSVKISIPLVVPDVKLEYRTLIENSIKLLFPAHNGQATIASDDHHFLVNISEGKLQSSTGAEVIFTPRAGHSYSIVLPSDTEIKTDSENKTFIPKGQKIRWNLNSGRETPIEILNMVSLEETNGPANNLKIKKIHPIRVLPGGMLQVDIVAKQMNFEERAPVFCFETIDGDTLTRIESIGQEMTSQKDGISTFLVRVPLSFEETRSQAGSARQILLLLKNVIIGTPAKLRVFNRGEEGMSLAISADLLISSPFGSAIIAFLGVSAVFIFAARCAGSWSVFSLFKQATRNSSGRYSLSNFQMLIWTVLVLFAFLFIWRANGVLLSISEGILVLLGISGFTAVSSRTIDSVRAPMSTSLDSGGGGRDGFEKIIQSADGSFDLLRLQMFSFTIFVWLYALVSVLTSKGLPEIPENLYLLMGISNLTFIAGKFSTDNQSDVTSPPSRGKSEKVDLQSLKSVQSYFNLPTTGIMDETTKKAIVEFKVKNNIIPADETVDEFLIARLGGKG